MMFLLARTDPAAKKQQGISFLLVDMKTPGITVNPIVNLTGAKDFCSVFFDNVRVPAKNLVGEPNQGWTMAKSVLGSERIMIGHPRFAKSALQALRQIGANRGLSEEPVFRHLYRGLAAEVADLEALYVRYLDALRNGRQLARKCRCSRYAVPKPGSASSRRCARRRANRARWTRRKPWARGCRCMRRCNSCMPGPRPSTAAATRSSATSWPRTC